MKSKDTVHKITVPQEKLDEAKAYSIHAEKMIYRGPFGGFKGKEISKDYTFRPVNTNDGLVYYTMTDVHHAREGAVAAARSVENLDFLVILGDSRGNHEIKGAYAELLYKYVGSKNESFYYWFTLSDVFGINLDLGEAKPYEDDRYTLVTSHIPLQFVNSRKDHVDVKAEWTKLLNQIHPDLAVYGHQHNLYPFLVGQETMYNEEGKLIYNSQFKGEAGKTYGGYLTDYTINGFIAGRRGVEQDDEISALNRKEHIGLAVYADLASGTQVCRFINTAGEVVPVYNPFAEGPAQTEFVLDLTSRN